MTDYPDTVTVPSTGAERRSWFLKPRDQREQWIARLGCIPVAVAVHLLAPTRAASAVVAAIAVGFLYLAAFAWWQARRTPISSASSPEPIAADARDEGSSERDGFFRNYFLPAFVH